MVAGAATYGTLSLDFGIYTSSNQIRLATPLTGDAAKEAMARELMLLRSRELALAVATDLQLDASPAFNAAPAPLTRTDRLIRLVVPDPDRPVVGETREERTLRLFTRSTRVTHAPGSDIFTVSFTSTDRNLAVLVVDGMVDRYRSRAGLPRSPRQTSNTAPGGAGALQVDVLTRATPWALPTPSERLRSAALAGGMTLFFGFFLAGLVAMGRRAAPMPSQTADTVSGLPYGTRTSGAIESRDRPALSSKGAQPIETVERLGQFLCYGSIDPLSRRLMANSTAPGGYRSLVVAETSGQDVREEAADLAAALCAAGKQVVLVDWNVDGTGIARALGVRTRPGFMDLIEDRATFDEVIQRLPDGDVHVIACGSPQSGGNLDTERLNLMLDTLDEVYDHIVVTGTDEAARVLFLGVEGRFDACIIVGDARPDGLRGPPETETFLGYHVTDIDLLRIEAIHPERHGVARLARSQDAALERV